MDLRGVDFFISLLALLLEMGKESNDNYCWSCGKPSHHGRRVFQVTCCVH